MGLLDGYFDPGQFGEGGGLLGRLLALQQMQGQGQHQPGAGFYPRPSATGQALSMPQAQAPVSPQSAAGPALAARPTRLPFGYTADPGLPNGGQPGPGGAARSIPDGQPPGLSKVGYLVSPTNANQAFGEISNIQERDQRNTVSRDDFVSAVREGNVRRDSDDGSLDVTNGTVVTFSYKDGHAKTVTVTNDDIAHIDGKTGDVVIQKSPLRGRI